MYYAEAGLKLVVREGAIPDARVVGEHVVAYACTHDVLALQMQSAYVILTFMDLFYQIQAYLIVFQITDS